MSRVCRGLSGVAVTALFAALMVVGAGSVAADSAPPCYVTGLNNGGTSTYCPPSAAGAAALSGYGYYGQPYVYANVPYSGVPYYGVPYAYTGVPVGYTYPTVPYYQPTGAVYGYTAAGPIVGVDGNGAALVYDVRGGTVDPYVIGPNGKWCEANNQGQCI